jgi:hypothetical protein
VSNLAEEIESLGKRDLRELESRMTVLLVHLLKWEYQNERRSRSWRSTIDEQRERIKRILADSPSLRPKLDARIEDLYRPAVIRAARETRIPRRTFPSAPISIGEALERDLEI